jgi:hypothetical protein
MRDIIELKQPEAKTGERTAGPWCLDETSKVKDLVYCDDETGSVIARCGGLGFEYVARSTAECEANAAFIVQACNAFPALVEALKLAEKADRIHSRCDDCSESAQAPEACEHCFPSADDARVARRNILKSLGVLMRDIDRSALEAAMKTEG